MLGKIIVTAFNAVSPIVFLILLGYILRRKGFLTEAFVKNGSKLIFKVALPCMLFVNVYGIDNMSDIPWRFLIYCVAVILVLFVVGLGLALAGTKVPERRGVIWQCCFRSNFAIIGMPLAAALGGEQASAVAAVVDKEMKEEIVGSIAGDDTIFIVVGDKETADKLTGRMKEYFS